MCEPVGTYQAGVYYPAFTVPVVQGNPRVYKALRNQMAEIYGELKRLGKCGGENDELLYTIQLIAQTMNGLKGEN